MNAGKGCEIIVLLISVTTLMSGISTHTPTNVSLSAFSLSMAHKQNKINFVQFKLIITCSSAYFKFLIFYEKCLFDRT